MKHFKNLNAPGFTFIEVMFAVMMVGTVLSALFLLQNSSFNSIIDFSGSLRRIFFIRNFLGENRLAKILKKKEKTTKTVDDPATKITIKTENVSNKSSLKKVKNIKIKKATAQWQEGIKKREETLINLWYKPPEKKR